MRFISYLYLILLINGQTFEVTMALKKFFESKHTLHRLDQSADRSAGGGGDDFSDVVSAVREGSGEAVVEGRPAFPVALVTEEEGATVQLLFEHQTHCKVWKAAIEGMLAEQKLKRGSN